MSHEFTKVILKILKKHFEDKAQEIFDSSELIQYINIKTKSAHKGSKARGSFGNLYSIFVLVEDYLNNDYDTKGDYSKYSGARFKNLLDRQRELPFGGKLQNHALNQRMNEEFKKYFPTCDFIPIIRVVETKRYWINVNLITLNKNGESYNLARPIIEIINAYITTKKNSFDKFIQTCNDLKSIKDKNNKEIKDFVISLLAPNVDARIFEIASYSILKADYKEQSIFFGFSMDDISEEKLKLYKTGRTNANDGGIDFVMKPLGRFFQVTETTDVKKYFLDIDKLERFPITFVIKSKESVDQLLDHIREGAKKQYSIEAVVEKYVSCVEEIINIDKLISSLDKVETNNKLDDVLSEIIKQSKVEFNYEEN